MLTVSVKTMPPLASTRESNFIRFSGEGVTDSTKAALQNRAAFPQVHIYLGNDRPAATGAVLLIPIIAHKEPKIKGSFFCCYNSTFMLHYPYRKGGTVISHD